MSMIARAEELLSRVPGSPMLRQEWVESELAMELEKSFESFPRAVRTARWCSFVGAPLIVFLALREVGPTGQEQFLAQAGAGSSVSWVVGDFSLLGFTIALALGLIYFGRHLPTAAFFPSCTGCGRVAETRRASIEGGHKCKRCGNNVPMEFIVYPKRRSLRSL